jgi:hypothetical protein
MARAAGVVHHGRMKRRWWALTVSLGALLLAGWIVFLVTVGLDRADRVSSVVAAILTALFGVAGLVVALRTRPGPPPAVQINEASGNGTVYGVQGGDLIIGDPGPRDYR